MYAQTTILVDGETIAEGSQIDKNDFGEGIWEGLVEAGAVAAVPKSVRSSAAASSAIAERDARIAELEALLADNGIETEEGEEAPSREDLETLANTLDVPFDEDTSDEELQAAIEAAQQ